MPLQMTAPAALEQLGVSPDRLTDDERRHLDERGYLVVDGLVTESQLQCIRTGLAQVVDERHRELEQESVLRKRAADRIVKLEKHLAERDEHTYMAMKTEWEGKVAALRTALED